MGRIREANQYFEGTLKSDAKLEKENLIVKISSGAADTVELCGATDTPYAIAAHTTKNRVANMYGDSKFDTGVRVALFRNGWARLNLKATNAAITVGDNIEVEASGEVDKEVLAAIPGTPTKASIDGRFEALERRVGIAQEDKAANAGGTILVALTLRGGSTP